ncbi:polyphenol oxidase family protein [Rhabdothermincola salaria]|uniref:polyphenol oxidase family protein n=1 Tax=Rhabdothermincola salaria TaxID=2903142 RepID=UPI001E2CC367|nr:polyphenol oxidase family protein [Rhabdothermincola salaria]MCD9622484.1 polyphenol oxidase family protein [Rhabdothermincola salaria]
MAPPRGRGVPSMMGPDLIALVRTTDVRDGDLHVEGEPGPLQARRRQILDRPWVWMRQVHGSDVVVLGDDDPAEAVAGVDADAVVTRRTDVVLAANSADCAAIALVGAAGAGPASTVVDRPDLADGAAIGVVHAGWRGLQAGVVGAGVAALRRLGVDRVQAHLGPCIGPECYEFDGPELDALVARFGPTVAGRTRQGRPALDLRLGVRRALEEAGAELVTRSVRCTACGTTTDAPDRGGWGSGGAQLFSHRARADAGRQAMLVWLERPSLGGPA